MPRMLRNFPARLGFRVKVKVRVRVRNRVRVRVTLMPITILIFFIGELEEEGESFVRVRVRVKVKVRVRVKLGLRERKCSQRCDRLIIEQPRRLVLGASSSLAFLAQYSLTKNRGVINNCNDGQLWGEI